MIKWIQKQVDATLFTACFHLTRKRHMKYHGEWRDVTQKLLPCYVFVETTQINGFREAIKEIPLLTRVMGRAGALYSALPPEEVAWLKELKGDS